MKQKEKLLGSDDMDPSTIAHNSDSMIEIDPSDDEHHCSGE